VAAATYIPVITGADAALEPTPGCDPHTRSTMTDPSRRALPAI